MGTHIDGKETGHIVEIQITLVALLAIKKGGGHAAYKLARLLELNAQVSFPYQHNAISSPARCRTTHPICVDWWQETTDFSGCPDDDTLLELSHGLIRKMVSFSWGALVESERGIRRSGAGYRYCQM